MKKFIFSILAMLFSFIVISQNEARLLRFPAIYENQIIFTYAGDLYTVDANGGDARKLTSDKGFEMFARFSPDGQTIAFTAQYDGNTEVYTIPSKGGVPKRVTITATLNRDEVSDRMGPNNIVMAWNPNSNEILYRSRKQSFNSFIGQLFVVNKDGGLSNEVPLPAGGFCSYSPDGTKLAYNRVFREFRTWKYYKGGMADDIWIFDFESKEIENVTNNGAQDIFPMWTGNKIYFASDRDRIMNLFVYDIETKTTEKITNFSEFDIKFPSLGKNHIVFENGGYIYKLNIENNEYSKVEIQLFDDMNWCRTELIDATKNLESFDISPDGDRLIISARGDIFTIPAEEGVTLNITESSGFHDRNAEYSPDGKYIAYISDYSGEDEIYIKHTDNQEKPKQITNGLRAYKFGFIWSPDSKKIAFTDKTQSIFYVDIETSKTVLIDTSESAYFRSYSWSPDSKWMIYSKGYKDKNNIINLYNLENKNITEVTEGWYRSTNPTFSNDGKYLAFSSNRYFSPIWSDVEWNHAYKDMAKIYLIPLRKNIPSPFTPKSNAKEDVKNDPFSIDLENISNRIIEIPVDPANYGNIRVIDDVVYFITRKHSDNYNELKLYNLKDKEETILGDKMNYTISSDSKKMLVNKAGDFYVINLPNSKIKLDNKIDLSGVKTWVNKKEEWNQIFYESWRQMRDFFYAPNMHGVDWESIKMKYEVLLPYVSHRKDLTYVIGEMIGELSVGHSYVSGGDYQNPERIKLGLLGAKVSKNENGYFKIDEILDGANWDPDLRSPLQEVSIHINQGDFILAINNKSTKDLVDINSELIGKANKQVDITISKTGSLKDAVKYTIIPIEDESNLYYYNWVKNNIDKVNKATNNEVGYIHLPDMLTNGLNQFAKLYYPQLSKKALIIDNRGNGGGNVSPMVIERLKREPDYYTIRGEADYGRTNPGGTFLGPKIMIIDQYAASDGDLVAYRFKKNKLGTVIGTRSWGGTVGIGPSLPFIDGGDLRIPILAPYSLDGKEWIIEGWGVEPDIEIDNNPAKEYAGEDEQLNKAIELILKEVEENEVIIPGLPAFPDKTK